MSLATKSLTHRFSRVMKLNAVAIAWTAACIGVLIASLVAVTRAPSAGTPPPLDYLDDASWAALPQLNDGADILPAWCGADAQPDAPADAFFVTPSSPLSYPSDNAPTDHMLTRLIDWSVIVMMATAFNGAANVYAPRYRTASSAVQGANVHSEFFNWRPIGEEPRVEAALELAFGDVERAFDVFVNRTSVPAGRPILLASHSQGTMHLKRLLGRLPSRRPEVLPRIAAAYLVGNTVEAAEVVPLPQCANATQTGCFVSWNTVLEGGTAGAYWQRKLVAEPQAACTNPLTWQAGHPNDDPNEDPADGEWAPAALHRGAVPITAHVLLSRLDTQLVRARCERGALYVSAPSSWGYPADIDGGELGCCGRMHAFDIPLFWANVRANAIARTDTFLNGSMCYSW